MVQAKKSLGQHWLDDEASLKAIVEGAEINADDTVLEIGPGLGSLTQHLVEKAGHVIAVELDEKLSQELPSRIKANNLEVLREDILKFDLSNLPLGYKVVANIPYYLTGNLLQIFTDSFNPPERMALLVQKEVAERMAASPGQMSILAVSVQLEYEVSLSKIVPAKLFTPPPKVDSQIVLLKKRSSPLFKDLDKKLFMRVVKAGFSARRKKLRSSLSAGLVISKQQADDLLKKAGIDGDLRAQNLMLEDWHKLYISYIVQDYNMLTMPKESYSAGGVVIGPNKLVLVVSQPGNVWSLPKGRLDYGENHMSAAVREIKEESGITRLNFIEKLGSYTRYKIGLNNSEDKSVIKNITMFLFTTTEEVLRPIDPENEEARWIEPDKVANLLTHPKDKEFYLSVLPKIESFINKSK